MKTMIIALLASFSTVAHADGFNCVVPQYKLNIQIYNSTHPSVGTRSGAIMIISDQLVQFGNKTIATFEAEAETLSSKELAYTGKVDLRHSGLSRKGENLLGTKLGELKAIQARIQFSYATPVAHNTPVMGTLSWEYRDKNSDGGRAFGYARIACVRYLKN
jgi:hypothetical protein